MGDSAVLQWAVVVAQHVVAVRKGRSTSSEQLNTHKKGDVVSGFRCGQWLQLTSEEGYMKLSDDDEGDLLRVQVGSMEEIKALARSTRLVRSARFRTWTVKACDEAARCAGGHVDLSQVYVAVLLLQMQVAAALGLVGLPTPSQDQVDALFTELAQGSHSLSPSQFETLAAALFAPRTGRILARLLLRLVLAPLTCVLILWGTMALLGFAVPDLLHHGLFPADLKVVILFGAVSARALPPLTNVILTFGPMAQHAESENGSKKTR